jgi:hypothetical protein
VAFFSECCQQDVPGKEKYFKAISVFRGTKLGFKPRDTLDQFESAAFYSEQGQVFILL